MTFQTSFLELLEESRLSDSSYSFEETEEGFLFGVVHGSWTGFDLCFDETAGEVLKVILSQARHSQTFETAISEGIAFAMKELQISEEVIDLEVDFPCFGGLLARYSGEFLELVWIGGDKVFLVRNNRVIEQTQRHTMLHDLRYERDGKRLTFRQYFDIDTSCEGNIAWHENIVSRSFSRTRDDDVDSCQWKLLSGDRVLFLFGRLPNDNPLLGFSFTSSFSLSTFLEHIQEEESWVFAFDVLITD